MKNNFIIWSIISMSYGMAQAAKPYSFSYTVADPESGNFQGHEQHQDENGITSGSYYHLAPDGMWHKTTFFDGGYGYTAGTRQMDPSSPSKGSSVSAYHYSGSQAKAFNRGLIGQSVLSGLRNIPPQDQKMPSGLIIDDNSPNRHRERSIPSTYRDYLLPSENLDPFQKEEDEIKSSNEGESEEWIADDYEDEISDASIAAKNMEAFFQKEILDRGVYPDQSASPESHLMSASLKSSKDSIGNLIANVHQQFSPPNEYDDNDEPLLSFKESGEEDLPYPSHDYLSSSEELATHYEELPTPIFDKEMKQLPENVQLENALLDLNSLDKRIRVIYSPGKPLFININNVIPLTTADHGQSPEIFEPAIHNSNESITKNTQKKEVQTQGSWSLETPPFDSSTDPFDSFDKVHPLPYLTSPLVIPLKPEISVQQHQQSEFDYNAKKKPEYNFDSLDNESLKDITDDTIMQYHYEKEGEKQNYSKIESSNDNKHNSNEPVTSSDMNSYKEGTLRAVIVQPLNLGSYDPSTRLLLPKNEFSSNNSKYKRENIALFISQNFLKSTQYKNRTSSEVIHQKRNDNYKAAPSQIINESIENNLPNTSHKETNENDSTRIESDINSGTVKVFENPDPFYHINKFDDSLNAKVKPTLFNNKTMLNELQTLFHSEAPLSVIQKHQREKELVPTEEKLIAISPHDILPIVVILNPSNGWTKDETEDILKNGNIFGTSTLDTEYGVKFLSEKVHPALQLTKININHPNDATDIRTTTELDPPINQENAVIPLFDKRYYTKELKLNNEILQNTNVGNEINSFPENSQSTDIDATEESYNNLEETLRKEEDLDNESLKSIEMETDILIPQSVITIDALIPTRVNKLRPDKEDANSREDESYYEVSNNGNTTVPDNDSYEQQIEVGTNYDEVPKIISNYDVEEDEKKVTAHSENPNATIPLSQHVNMRNRTNPIYVVYKPKLTRIISSEKYNISDVTTDESDDKSERIKLLEAYKKRVVDILVPQILKTVNDMIPSLMNNRTAHTTAAEGGAYRNENNHIGVENQVNNNTSNSSEEYDSLKQPIINSEIEKSSSQEFVQTVIIENEQFQRNSKLVNENNFQPLHQIDSSTNRGSNKAGQINENNSPSSTSVYSTSSSSKMAQNETLPDSLLVNINRNEQGTNLTPSPENPKTNNTLFETQITQILNKLRGNPIFEHLDQESLPVTSLILSENPKDISTISFLVDGSNDFSNKESAIKYITEELKKTIHPTLVAANFYSIPLAKKSQVLQSDTWKGPKLAIHGRETKIRRAQLQSVISHPVKPTEEPKDIHEIAGEGNVIRNYDTGTRSHQQSGAIFSKTSPILKWSEILSSKSPPPKTEATTAELKTTILSNPLDRFHDSSSIIESDQSVKSVSQIIASGPPKINTQEIKAGVKLESGNLELNTTNPYSELKLENQTFHASNIPKEESRTRTNLPSKQFIQVRRKINNNNLLSNKINGTLMKETPLAKRDASNVEAIEEISTANIFLTEPILIAGRRPNIENEEISDPSSKVKRRNKQNELVSNKRLLTIVDLHIMKDRKSLAQLRPFIQIPSKIVNKMASANSFGIYRNPNPVELKPVKMNGHMTSLKFDDSAWINGGENVTIRSIQSRPFRYFSLRAPNNGTSVRKGTDKRKQPSGLRKSKPNVNSRQFRYVKRKELVDDSLAEANKALEPNEHGGHNSIAKENSPMNIHINIPEIKHNATTNQTSEKIKRNEIKGFSTNASVTATENSIPKGTPKAYVIHKEPKQKAYSQNDEMSTTVDEIKIGENNVSLSSNVSAIVSLNVNIAESIEQQLTTMPPTRGNNALKNKTLAETVESTLSTTNISNTDYKHTKIDSPANVLKSMPGNEFERPKSLNANVTALNQHSEPISNSYINMTTMETSIVISSSTDDSTKSLFN